MSTGRVAHPNIQELIQANVTRYSQKDRADLAVKINRQMQQLPHDTPLDIPDPTVAINKANLMAMEHNNRLNVLDQIIPKSMWGTPKHTALLKEMGIDAVQITKRNSLHVPFTLHHFKGTEKEIALLDTGATESFVDRKTVQRLKLGTQTLDTPRPIYNMDGSPNKTGTIMQVCYLQVI